jgi:hypothetical protein
MRIGLVVEGQSERYALPTLTPRIPTTSQFIGPPLYADMQPTAPPLQIALAVKGKLLILAQRRVDLALVLIDREQHSTCAGAWATTLQAAIAQTCGGSGVANFTVVVKDRKFENWLVADTAAFNSIRGRFRLTTAQVSSVTPNKADTIDAERILKDAAQKRAYEKYADSGTILERADPLAMAKNSRSFRRFLRMADCPPYQQQSRLP